MPYIEKFILPPPPGQLNLFGYLVILISILHFTFMGIFLGASLLSVIFNILDKKQPSSIYSRFSKDLLETGMHDRSLGVIFGILPMVSLFVLFPQILYGSGLSIGKFGVAVLLFLVGGLVLIHVYKHTFPERDKQFLLHISSGILGLALLLAAYFTFISATTLITDFEKRFFIRSPDPYSLLFSWNVIARYKIFLLASLAITGGAILFYFFRWAEEEKSLDEEYRTFLKNIGAGLPLPCIMSMPIFFVWSLITLPKIALSTAVFVLTSLSIVLLMVIFYMLYGIWRHGVDPHGVLHKDGVLFKSRLAFYDKSKFVSPVLILFFLTFSLLSINDQITIENAIRDNTLDIVVKAEEAEKAAAAKAEAAKAEAEAAKSGEKVGENIFNARCTACHRYSEKLVGPPLNAVLPKYQPNPDRLAVFIQNPKKINPEYPPMPNYGLNELEATSVASYVLDRLKREGSP